MKQLLRFSFLLLTILPSTATAHDFEVDGIYYNINGSEATVTYKGIESTQYEYDYSGDVSIPSTVTYNGATYSVTTIGNNAFYSCNGLTNIDIPNSVTSIESHAFWDCTGLTSVTIPNSVTTIGNAAFAECSGLISITIPNSVTTIGNAAFAECSGLTSITIPNSVTTIGSNVFQSCSGLTRVTIPNSITTIGEGVFRFCSSLTSVTIPNSVTTIGDYMFQSCSGLTSVTIGNSVTTIGEGAFSGCTGLTSITIPNSVISIGGGAFSSCTGLTCIDIPNSVTSIGMYAFYETAWYNNQPDGLVYAGLVAYKYKGTIPQGTQINIKNSTKGIAGGAFSSSSLTSIEIPNSVTIIGEGAFQDCHGLATIDLPNSVTTIDNYVFYNCDSLKDVYSYISDPSAITMGSYVFYQSPNIYDTRTLHVPIGSVAAYQADTNWSQFFGSIIEMAPVLAESIKLNVTTAGLNEGATLQLTATVLPDDCADKTVLWSSDNPSVATVDSNGLVTTHSIGTATITAMTADGSNLSTTCTVTLLPVGVKGDVNGDTNITIADVSKLIDYLLTGSWD